MEEEKKVGGYWWWALGSSVQLAGGISSYRRGFAGSSHFMPFKAFTVASLFVGAGATAIVGLLRASGIHKVEDVKGVGASIRSRKGISQREAN